MPKQRFWVFRLYDSAGQCLYVGKTVHHPSRIVRTYRNQRSWGDQIDPARTVMAERATEVTATNAVNRWSARFSPLHRATVPALQPDPDAPERPQPSRRLVPAPDSLLARAAAAQARHREMSKHGV